MARKRLPSTATDKEHEAYEAFREIGNEIDKAASAAIALQKSMKSGMRNEIDPVTVLAGTVEAQTKALQQIGEIYQRAMAELEKE